MAAPWPLPFRCVVDHVYDGDTVYGVVHCDAGLGITVTLGETYRLWAIRFYGINAPELKAPDPAVRAQAEAARDYLMTLVQPGDTLSVESYGWDNYGRRIDGKPFTAAGLDLCALMLEQSGVVPYS
jgi:endonuclease YncB( thermonuclease family)